MSIERKTIDQLPVAASVGAEDRIWSLQSDDVDREITAAQFAEFVKGQLGDNVRVKVGGSAFLLQLRDRSELTPGWRTIWLVDGAFTAGPLET